MTSIPRNAGEPLGGAESLPDFSPSNRPNTPESTDPKGPPPGLEATPPAGVLPHGDATQPKQANVNDPRRATRSTRPAENPPASPTTEKKGRGKGKKKVTVSGPDQAGPSARNPAMELPIIGLPIAEPTGTEKALEKALEERQQNRALRQAELVQLTEQLEELRHRRSTSQLLGELNRLRKNPHLPTQPAIEDLEDGDQEVPPHPCGETNNQSRHSSRKAQKPTVSKDPGRVSQIPIPTIEEPRKNRATRSRERRSKTNGPNSIPSDSSSSSSSSDSGSSNSSNESGRSRRDRSLRRRSRNKNSKRKTVKLPDPEKFTGSHDPEFEIWRTDVIDKLYHNRDHFRTEAERMRYVWSALKGTPKKALHSRYGTDHPLAFKTCKEMFKALSSRYEDPDRRDRNIARWRFLTMNANETVQQFALRFGNIAGDAHINTEEQLHWIGSKLNSNLRRQLNTYSLANKTAIVDMELEDIWDHLAKVQTVRSREKDEEELKQKMGTVVPRASLTAAVPSDTTKEEEKTRGSIPAGRTVRFPAVPTATDQARANPPAIKPPTAPETAGACYNCGSKDHYQPKCPHPRKTRINEISEAQDWTASDGSESDLEPTGNPDPKNENT